MGAHQRAPLMPSLSLPLDTRDIVRCTFTRYTDDQDEGDGGRRREWSLVWSSGPDRWLDCSNGKHLLLVARVLFFYFYFFFTHKNFRRRGITLSVSLSGTNLGILRRGFWFAYLYVDHLLWWICMSLPRTMSMLYPGLRLSLFAHVIGWVRKVQK